MFGSAYLLGLLISAPCGALLYVAAPRVYGRFQHDEDRRRRFRGATRWVAFAVATGMPVVPLTLIAIPNPPGLMLAVPGAVCAVWVLHRLQRHRRLPLRASLAAFAWGSTFGMTVGLMFQMLYNAVWSMAVHDMMGQLWQQMAQGKSMEDIGVPNPLAGQLIAPATEEFAKAVGVVLIFHTWRARFDNVVHGIVVGAMVGAGFNFIETVRFAHTTFDFAMHQIWIRQWVSGFFFGHVLFTGLVGAALGLASRYTNWAGNAAIVSIGFALAVFGHFLWNYLSTSGGMPWESDDPLAGAFATIPLNYLTVSGPFLLILLIPLWYGLCREAAALRVVLPIEAMTGSGAITPTEAVTLASPSRRVGERLVSIRSLGPLGYFRVGRLHAAQLDLAMERWKLAHDPDRVSPDSETDLRNQILARKDQLDTAAGRGRS